MTEDKQTDIVDDDPDIPAEMPPAGGGTTEIDDEPLGVPADGDSSVSDQPGIPEGEPPASE